MAVPAVVVALLATACGDDDDAVAEPEPEVESEVESEAEPGPVAEFDGGGIDPTVTRDDIGCSPKELDEDPATPYTVIHYVVDGDLGAVCFGETDEAVVDAWSVLADITPPGQLSDLAVFTGFVSEEGGDEETLAFVAALDDEGQQFEMAVNVDLAADDPDGVAVTIAHEFSHVFTALPTELDRSFESIDSCDTYDSGEGCYYDDSLMFMWIEEFWGDGLIEEIDPNEEPTVSDGQDRCDLDEGFFGAYAASSPEEDFAESFSAYVMAVAADSDAQQARLEWMDEFPGLREFRGRAEAAGYGPMVNTFDPCGAG